MRPSSSTSPIRSAASVAIALSYRWNISRNLDSRTRARLREHAFRPANRIGHGHGCAVELAVRDPGLRQGRAVEQQIARL
ncbi:hypothetical protein [Streptomyces sp. SA15]|uniref:hypothetical protein n=1 Tax=Streptomyces sp. SA15 TaxID=934019 RepID=UPI00117F00B8|nr:hypothetical protein [Streptomyces sp. SA15]